VSYARHQARGANIVARVAVVTLSDTRTPDTDASGQRIRELLTAAGHTAADYRLLPDDAPGFAAALDEFLARADVDAIVTNGGTGISRRDASVDVVAARLDVPLPGFGELFRMLSWEQVGSGAMLSRAIGGIARGKPLFALPGSTKAVELAMTKLILPELGHLIGELQK